uniref:Uncharacterized protein n=1 Tax=Anopheles atroparvus TaxID=41427 RepID=A0A182JN99_ANOAO
MFLKELLFCILIGWIFLPGFTSATGDPLIVQYQQWFSEYASIAEERMALKRAANSNKTLTFNIELLGMLASATSELRTVDNATVATIQQADTIGEPCRQVVLQLFNIFRTVGQTELQGCAAYASRELQYWTTQRFFSYANIAHRDSTELTHRVALVLEQYNKVTEMGDIAARLEDEYYTFNSYNNALQEVLNRELERLDPPDHPVRLALRDCLDTTVTLHQTDMEYVLSYVDDSCGF